MFIKRKIILIISIFIVVGLFWLAPEFFDYLEYKKVAEAVGGMPWQDGGVITYVGLCAPTDPAGNCAMCPNVTALFSAACNGYNELDVTSQQGTTFIAVPKTFVYSGGGTFPSSGMQYIAGGASNVMPWVIGIPGVSASRIQKLVDTFKYIIAGSKR